LGALGIPVITLATVTGLPVDLLSAMVGRILVLFCVVVPFWAVWTVCGRKSMLEVWPACLTTGLSLGATQYLISNYIGPSLAANGASLVSMAALIVLLRFWKPGRVWAFQHDGGNEGRKAFHATSSSQGSRTTGSTSAAATATAGTSIITATPQLAEASALSTGRKLKAWSPWILLSVFAFISGLTPVKDFLNGGTAASPNFQVGIPSISVPVPMLHKAMTRTPPVVSAASAEPALLADGLRGLLLGFSSLPAISAMLALGFPTRYAGLDATMGLTFASTGAPFPFFSPLLGWLGVARTGSDASSRCCSEAYSSSRLASGSWRRYRAGRPDWLGGVPHGLCISVDDSSGREIGSRRVRLKVSLQDRQE